MKNKRKINLREIYKLNLFICFAKKSPKMAFSSIFFLSGKKQALILN